MANLAGVSPDFIPTNGEQGGTSWIKLNFQSEQKLMSLARHRCLGPCSSGLYGVKYLDLASLDPSQVWKSRGGRLQYGKIRAEFSDGYEVDFGLLYFTS